MCRFRMPAGITVCTVDKCSCLPDPDIQHERFKERLEAESAEEALDLPPYYDNSKGSLYKVATERGWNPYLFDVCKRLERGGKKDPLVQEIDKSIAVLQLWKKEIEQ
jgi:hypothetical protein